MSDKIRAPFTPEQIDALTTYQTAGFMHPFTCGGGGGPHSDVSLHAQADGWHCPVEGCTHRQDWAHTFMADRRYWPDIRTGREVSAMSDDNRSRDEASATNDDGRVQLIRRPLPDRAHHIADDLAGIAHELREGNAGTSDQRLRLAAAIVSMRMLGDDLREQLAAANARAEKAAARIEEIGPLTPAGQEYRANGPFVHEVSEAHFRTYPGGWTHGYWPEVRQLYGGPWRELPDATADGHSATQTSAQT